MISIPATPSVRATIPARPSVSRAWKVRGSVRLTFRANRAGGPARREAAAGSAVSTTSSCGPAASVLDSALGECVADSSDGQHERRSGRVVLDLLPEVADMDVDRLFVLVEGGVVAQELEEFRARLVAVRSRGVGGRSC